MKTYRPRGFWVARLAVMLGCVAFFLTPSAYGESYIGGQFGVTLPSVGKGLTDVDLTGSFPNGSTMSDRALKSSILYGGKVGHFFSRARWFGIEAEVFITTPHIKHQPVTISIPSTPTTTGGTTSGHLSGDHFRVLTIAPLNLVFRYPKARLQPYVAVGPGIFIGKVTSIAAGFEGSQTDTKLGLNANVGLRYFITRRLSAFGEWKYNHVRFNFKEEGPQFGFNATYNMHHAAFGVAYHF